MKRVLRLAVVAALVLGGSAPAVAEPGGVPNRVPTMLTAATTYVYPRTTYTIACVDYGAVLYRSPATMFMLGYTLSTPKGKRVSSNLVVVDRLRSEFITASGAGTTVTQVVTSSPNANPGNYLTTYTVTPKAIGILRVGSAAWDGFVPCFVAYGAGYAGMQLMAQSATQARFLYPSDLGGGVGVGTGSASVAAAQSYSHTVSGSMFAVFRPDIGSAKITDPKGKVRYDSLASASRSVTIIEASKGSWTFTLDANASRSRTPALWIMAIR